MVYNVMNNNKKVTYLKRVHFLNMKSNSERKTKVQNTEIIYFYTEKKKMCRSLSIFVMLPLK